MEVDWTPFFVVPVGDFNISFGLTSPASDDRPTLLLVAATFFLGTTPFFFGKSDPSFLGGAGNFFDTGLGDE